ncbi:MAG: YARHG domain-containing protein [Clostridia bacterium]|nr:YARHG domain-containing protein [Clostridia bacterium]
MKHAMRILCVALCLTLLPGWILHARADQLYLIPDSDTRRLEEEELWKWDRESLSFIFNEIFARHGYVFNAGGKYDLWFRAMPWYTPNSNPDNQKYCYPKVSQLEWDNYHTIKRVAAQMDALRESAHTKGRKCYTQLTPPGNWFLSGFSYIKLRTDQKLPVYAAPSASAWRGANGKAMVSTNGAVWAAGWEKGWLLVFYETNNNSIRVGYVNGKKITGKVPNTTQLMFERTAVTVSRDCALTDDPLMANVTMANLRAGAQVTYLTSMVNQNGQMWDYVETTIGGKTARGFVPRDCLNYVVEALPDYDYDNG